MVLIDMPRRAKRRRATRAGGAASASVVVRGIEVTQAVQNLNHDTRLVADKRTIARVYLEPSNLSSNVDVQGEIVVAPTATGPGNFVASTNAVTLKAARHPTLAQQRRDAGLSLNFVLPSSPPGPLSVKFHRAIPSGGPDMPILPGNDQVSVRFVAGVPLRVRALGLRYVDARLSPAQSFSPKATHFDHLRSFLLRAYPVPSLDWTQMVIDAPVTFVPPFSGPQVPPGSGNDPLWRGLLRILHTHMMSVRQGDITAGWDPRTHYYGLVADDSGFFRGAATDVPDNPAPQTVAVGPVGVPRSGNWDTDGSYGDWYGAHELAHTFGRKHPGFCQGQPQHDGTYPHPGGRISDDTQDSVGFDVGEPELGLPMRAYAHETWHDVMTYCDQQWISKYTYDGIFDRLAAEEVQFAPLTA